MRTHPYKITRQKSGRWKTYIRRATGARKAVERNNRDDLIEFLYQHYSEDDKKSAVMDRVFDEFLEYKRDVLSRSQETVERIRYTYRRFMTEEIRQRKMSSITETELMRYVRSIVDAEHPKERALKSFLQMIHGLFRFGHDNHYTSSDVSKRIVAENFYKDCDCSKNILTCRNTSDPGSSKSEASQPKGFYDFVSYRDRHAGRRTVCPPLGRYQ